MGTKTATVFLQRDRNQGQKSALRSKATDSLLFSLLSFIWKSRAVFREERRTKREEWREQKEKAADATFLFGGEGGICSRLRARSGLALTAHRAVIHHQPVQIPSHKKQKTPHKWDVFCFGGEGGIWTLAPVTRPTPLAGAPLHHLSTSP